MGRRFLNIMEFFLLMVSAGLFFAGVSAYAVVSVPPGQLMQVEFSASNVNRVVCVGGEIKDIVYSREKGLTVKVLGSDAFIKFPVLQKEDKPVYAENPAEVYIACGDEVYSIIAVPRKIPSATVQVEDKKKRLKENASVFKGLAFEEKIIKLLRHAYVEEYPDTFVIEEVSGPASAPEFKYSGLELTLRRKVSVSGEGLVLYEYILMPHEDMGLGETDFMALAKRPVAIALDSTLLKNGSRYRLFVVDYPILQDGGQARNAGSR